MIYEQLLNEALQNNLEVYEENMPSRLKGLYAENVVWINKHLPTCTEKACVLAEEIGHYHTTTGNILDQNNIENRKQELKARAWAYERLVPLSQIIQARNLNITNRYELADFLNVTEEFLEDAISWYRNKYGLYVQLNHYIICFNPLGVVDISE